MIPEQTLLGFPLFGDNATKVEPDNNKKSNGWQQGDVVPAEWLNWEWYHASRGIADLNKGVSSMEKEIIAVLTEYGIVPAEATEDQLKSALLKMRPQICECSTAASTAAKSVSLSGNVLKAGNIYVITMTNGNTAANPTLSFNSGTAYPMCKADGVALGSGAWKAGDIITVIYTGTKYLMFTQAVTNKIENTNMNPVTSNAVSCVISDDPNPTVLTGPELGVGANFKVLFKAEIGASDTTTPLALTYNGTSYTVKARKDGALQNVYAYETATNVFKFLQAYTTIEFVYDGTNLIIMGNPVVLSGTDYTIYADGYNSMLDNIFSLSEIKTNMRWLDGRPIYKKTVDTGSLPSSAGDKFVNHGISNLDMAIHFEGVAFSPTSKVTLNLPHVANNKAYDIAVDVRETQIDIYVGTNRSTYSISYVTIFYVKTTD